MQELKFKFEMKKMFQCCKKAPPAMICTMDWVVVCEGVGGRVMTIVFVTVARSVTLSVTLSGDRVRVTELERDVLFVSVMERVAKRWPCASRCGALVANHEAVIVAVMVALPLRARSAFWWLNTLSDLVELFVSTNVAVPKE